jgi:hypothetical protein
LLLIETGQNGIADKLSDSFHESATGFRVRLRHHEVQILLALWTIVTIVWTVTFAKPKRKNPTRFRFRVVHGAIHHSQNVILFKAKQQNVIVERSKTRE